MAAMYRELTVMNEVASIMSALNTDEQRRVVRWLEDFFDVYDEYAPLYTTDEAEADAPVIVIADAETDEADVAEATEEEAAPAPMTFNDFYAQVAPNTAIQKIVTAAYWLETRRKSDVWTSFQANKLLKSIDVVISSVSGTLSIEQKKAVPMIDVIQKDGDSMQSRKNFRLADAGIAFVEGRLN